MKKQIDVEKITAFLQVLSDPDLLSKYMEQDPEDVKAYKKQTKEPEIPIVVGGVYEFDNGCEILIKDILTPDYCTLSLDFEYGSFLDKDVLKKAMKDVKYLGKAEIRVQGEKKGCCKPYTFKGNVNIDQGCGIAFFKRLEAFNYCPECGVKL